MHSPLLLVVFILIDPVCCLFIFSSFLFFSFFDMRNFHLLKKKKADDFLEDILNLEAGLEEADRNRVMDTSSQHQTLPPEVKKIKLK